MRFSVVIPVYNRSEIVGEAIASVLNQSVADFEVIVVDDGSTDGTAEMIRKRYGSEVRLLQQENKGPGAARNRGIEAARGEYVTFLDSDDVWFPWTLSVFDRAIRRHEQVSFVGGTHETAESRKEGYTNLGTGLDDYRDQWWPDYYTAAEGRPLWIGTPAVAIRRKALRSVGNFTTARTNAEDSDLWMRLGTTPGFVRVHQPPVFAYRRGGDSQVQDLRKTFRGIKRMIESERRGDYPGGRARSNQRRKLLTRHTRAASLTLARAGHVKQARFLYECTIQWNWNLHRFKYLLGAPFIFAVISITSCFPVSRPHKPR
jgi:glycosyltransferase involved in cell wall biosynthesis